jgi:sigma-B regulation protein RsbU (phosphoserine phosphatase)
MLIESTATADQDAMALSTAQMKDILEVSRLLAITANLESLLEKLALATCRLLYCEGSSIWLFDPRTDELYTTVVIISGSIRLPAASGIVGAAFRTRSIVSVPDAYADPRFNPSSDRATGFVTRSLMASPMVDIHGTPIGVIEAVNKIGGGFTLQDESLMQLFADQAGVAIQRHDLQHKAQQAAELQREISLARNVQQALLPKVLPALPGFDLFGWAKSASTTGGDCYDLWELSDGRLGVFLADASGHGLGPALVVSQIRTLVRTLCDGSSKLCTPHDVMMRVNHRLSQDLHPEQFVTAFLGFLHLDGTLEWQSAGHGPILYRPSCDEPIQALPAAIPPLNSSVLPDEPPAPLRLGNGGMLAVMSDGIFESFDEDDQLFGIHRVMESLQDTCHDSAATAVDKLVAVVADWQKGEQPKDDQTIILVNRLMQSH